MIVPASLAPFSLYMNNLKNLSGDGHMFYNYQNFHKKWFDLISYFVDLVKFLMCLCRMTVVFLEFVNKENTNMVYESKFLEVLDSNFIIPHTKLYGATIFLN